MPPIIASAPLPPSSLSSPALPSSRSSPKSPTACRRRRAHRACRCRRRRTAGWRPVADQRVAEDRAVDVLDAGEGVACGVAEVADVGGEVDEDAGERIEVVPGRRRRRRSGIGVEAPDQQVVVVASVQRVVAEAAEEDVGPAPAFQGVVAVPPSKLLARRCRSTSSSSRADHVLDVVVGRLRRRRLFRRLPRTTVTPGVRPSQHDRVDPGAADRSVGAARARRADRRRCRRPGYRLPTSRAGVVAALAAQRAAAAQVVLPSPRKMTSSPPLPSMKSFSAVADDCVAEHRPGNILDAGEVSPSAKPKVPLPSGRLTWTPSGEFS